MILARPLRLSLAAAAFLVLLSSSARADFPLDASQQRCARGAIDASVKVLQAYGKAAAKCVRAITTGQSAEAAVTPCVTADPDGKLSAAQTKLVATIDARCSTPAYATDCVVPCDAADAGGATDGVDDSTELASCLTCLNPASSLSGPTSDPALKGVHGAILDDVTLAQPSEPDLSECQRVIVKVYDKLFVTEAKELSRCATREFKNGAPAPPDACVGADPRGVIAKGRAKLASVTQRCAGVGAAFNAGACSGLAAGALAGCLDTVVSCGLCRWASVELGSLFDCDEFDDGDANGSCAPPATTTTTNTICTTTTTTTTLAVPDPLCPDVVELVVRANITTDACTTNTDCETGTCDTSLARCRTATDLDWGTSGFFHDVDISDRAASRVLIRCSQGGGATGSCGACKVLGVDTSGGTCRCENDSSAACDVAFGPDPDDCGGANCFCYASPPLPLDASGIPFCLVPRYERAPRGLINVDSGAIGIDTPLRIRTYLGDSNGLACPVCAGRCTAGRVDHGCLVDFDCDTGAGAGDGVCGPFDTAARDGLREGRCFGSGASDPIPCDVDAVNTTFPALGGVGGYSLDCLPHPARNVSGSGLRIRMAPRTGAAAPVTAALPCVFDTESCHCGLCAQDHAIACSTNADCAPEPGTCGPGAGVCEARSGESPNACDNFECADLGGGEGECATGPDYRFCDGRIRADGRGIVPCNNNADCAVSSPAGNCTLEERAKCFPDVATASGAADPFKPVTSSIACSPVTASTALDNGPGIPGPMRVTEQLELTSLCTNDHGVVYSPGVGGCP